ncbi:MAG: Cupin 2 conserved barrel domain protein [Clostridiales bacterium]|jgi:quercetin dioxygenase-like cupin family protein|nr:Cupin 2 conserved barrel domain protein [Clostridiales bacterium]
MFILDQKEVEYRFGDSGPKYIMRGPRMNFGVVRLKPGEDFDAHFHNIMEENFFVLEGTLEINVDGDIHTLTEGQFIHIEPTEIHYLKNPSNTQPLKCVFALSPFQNNDKVVVATP